MWHAELKGGVRSVVLTVGSTLVRSTPHSALRIPHSGSPARIVATARQIDELGHLQRGGRVSNGGHGRPSRGARVLQGGIRSEERRVGKECRSRWSPYH